MASQVIVTRQRIFGADTEFSAWFRAHPDLQKCHGFGCTMNDVDFIIHRYMNCVDGVGSRETQGLMMVETKTHDSVPRPAQLDSLYALNSFKGVNQIDGVTLRNFGVFVLTMSGTNPKNSERMTWGYFHERQRRLLFHPIDETLLVQILKFEVRPDSFQP